MTIPESILIEDEQEYDDGIEHDWSSGNPVTVVSELRVDEPEYKERPALNDDEKMKQEVLDHIVRFEVPKPNVGDSMVISIYYNH